MHTVVCEDAAHAGHVAEAHGALVQEPDTGDLGEEIEGEGAKDKYACVCVC